MSFQEESSIEFMAWVWAALSAAIGGAGGAEAPPPTDGPTKPQKEILLHDSECKLQSSGGKTSPTVLGTASSESQHLQFFPDLYTSGSFRGTRINTVHLALGQRRIITRLTGQKYSSSLGRKAVWENQASRG